MPTKSRRNSADDPSPSPQAGSRSRSWPFAALILAGALTYANSLSGAFVLDDQSTIVDNATIREWWRPSSVLVPEANTAIAGRPIVNLSFAINYAVGGLDVRGYHIVNIALHIVCALLAFGIIRRTLELPKLGDRFTGRSTGVAFAAALLWLVHPLNSEVVDYLTERTESLMALFYLLTLYASIRSAASERSESALGESNAGTSRDSSEVARGHRGRMRDPGRRRTGAGRSRGVEVRQDRSRSNRWSAAALIACALGMACKESMVGAPIAVLLFDRVFLFESFGRAVRARAGFYAGLAASWLVLAGLMSSGPRSAVGGFSTGVPVWTWLLNQTQMIAHYLRLVFWPRSLVVFYGWPLSVTLADVLPYALLVAALLVATAVALVRWPMLGFPGAWFFLTLAPTSSIIPIATEVGAERRMYLPLLAISVLVVLAITALWGKLTGSLNVPARRHAIAGVAALVIIAGPMVVATMARNREYESALTLARTVVARRPSAVTRHYLAEQLSLAGLHDEAIPHLREAVAAGDSRAGFLLGIELFNAGKFDDAVRQLTAFVRTSKLPYRLVPHWLEPPLSEVVTARLVLARTAAMQRRWPDTVEQAKLVLDAVPGNREAQLFLADGLFGEQQYAAAAAEYQKYLTARPNDGHALTNLGITYIVAGNLDDAIASFRRAVAAEPKNPDWHRLLGMAMMDRGDSEGAAAEAREGLRLKPGDAALGELLARATAAGKPRP